MQTLDSMQTLAESIASWSASGGASLAPHPEGGQAFTDSTGNGPHVLRFADPALEGAMLHLTLRARPLPGCTTHLMVLHPMAGAVCRIAANGTPLRQDLSSSLSVSRADDGTLSIAVSYFSTAADIAVGTAGPAPFYPGTGRPQWVFEEIALAVSAPATDDEHRIVALDIGGSGPLAPAWRGLMPNLLPLAIPPADGPATALEQAFAAFPGGRVIAAVPYNKKGRRKLNRTADPARSSLLTPDRRTLRKFADPAPFEVQEQVSLDCIRYEDLHTSGAGPAPELIRLNARGAEHEVLQGFGSLLAGCLGIELHTAFYPVYKGQKPLSDIIALLAKFDLSLAGLTPRREGGQIVETQAWFLKSAEWAEAQPRPVQARLAALRRATGLPA